MTWVKVKKRKTIKEVSKVTELLHVDGNKIMIYTKMKFQHGLIGGNKFINKLIFLFYFE